LGAENYTQIGCANIKKKGGKSGNDEYVVVSYLVSNEFPTKCLLLIEKATI